jgi:hypothetical protein
MKHALFEDRITHAFAIVRLPARFVEGDKVPVPPDTQWFRTREEAVATLSHLFDQDEDGHSEHVRH